MKYKLLTFVLLICVASCIDEGKCKVDTEEQSTLKSVLITTDSCVHLVDTTCCVIDTTK